jgi:hypothetical protein
MRVDIDIEVTSGGGVDAQLMTPNKEDTIGARLEIDTSATGTQEHLAIG